MSEKAPSSSINFDGFLSSLGLGTPAEAIRAIERITAHNHHLSLHDASDVVQLALMIVNEKILNDEYDASLLKRGDPKDYLFSVVRNAFLDWRRTTMRRRNHECCDADVNGSGVSIRRDSRTAFVWIGDELVNCDAPTADPLIHGLDLEQGPIRSHLIYLLSKEGEVSETPSERPATSRQHRCRLKAKIREALQK